MYYETALVLLDKITFNSVKLKKSNIFIITGSGKPQEIEYISSRTTEGVLLYTFEVAYDFNETTQFKLTQDEVFRTVYWKKEIYKFN